MSEPTEPQPGAPPIRRSRLRCTVHGLMVAVAIAAFSSFAAISSRGGVAPVLLGPFLLVMDAAPENRAFGTGSCLLLLPCLAVGVARPRWWSVTAAVLAGLAWLALGAVGLGIGC